jgi:hypothetical protein
MKLPDSVVDEGNINKKQDLLIYGKDYHLWRDGKYLGIATYVDDKNIGEAFVRDGVTKSGEACTDVFIADEWSFS